MSVCGSCCRRITTDSIGSLCTALPHLGHLALSAAAAPDLLGAVACLSGLRHLEVADCNRVSDLSLCPIKYLTALRSLTLRGLTEVNLSRYLCTHVLSQDCLTCFALHLNILVYTQVTATGYSNIAQAPQLTSLIINHPACDSVCMHALAQLSTLVVLQLEAEWATAAVEHEKVKVISLKGQRCSPPRSLGSLTHLYVLRFLNTMVHWQPFVLRPDDVDLPDLDPAEALAHMRLLRAVQTGCTIDEYRISMMHNKVEENYDRALPLIWGDV